MVHVGERESEKEEMAVNIANLIGFWPCGLRASGYGEVGISQVVSRMNSTWGFGMYWIAGAWIQSRTDGENEVILLKSFVSLKGEGWTVNKCRSGQAFEVQPEH